MLLNQTRRESRQHKTLLGRTSIGSVVHMPPAIFEGEHSSDLTIIVGITGTGKSMLKRAKISQEIYQKDSQGRTRPTWMFDSKGRDDYLGYRPNKSPKDKRNMIPGRHPQGIPGFYLYFPVNGARKKAPWELTCRPNFGRYSIRQLEAMGFRGAAPKNLRDIMEKYGPFRSIQQLQERLEQYPTSDRDARAKKPGSLKYKEGDIMRHDVKYALVRDFRLLVVERGVWTMVPPQKRTDGTKREVDFVITDKNGRDHHWTVEGLFLSGRNVIFSYNDTIVAKAETHYTLKKQVALADQYPTLPKPHDRIEEAHEVLEDDLIVDFVRTARKQGIALDIILPTLQPFAKKETSDVANDAKQWIVGKLKGKNKKLAAEFIDHPAAYTIPYLKLNRHRNIREFLYFNGDEDAAYGPFQAFECPQDYNRRI